MAKMQTHPEQTKDRPTQKKEIGLEAFVFIAVFAKIIQP